MDNENKNELTPEMIEILLQLNRLKEKQKMMQKAITDFFEDILKDDNKD
jgi:hypothetical protein